MSTNLQSQNSNTVKVILHGWMHDKSMWEPFAARFGDDTAIALDLPGFGEEPIPSYEWGIEEYSNWVEEKITKILQKTNNRKVILVGHSFGGRVASFIASKQPKWLTGLVLVGSPSVYRPSTRIRAQNKFAPIAKKILPKSLTKKIAPKFTSDDYEDVKTTEMRKIYENIVRFDQTKLLPNIAVPTLIIYGENDEEVSLKTQEDMHALIPRSKLKIIPDKGHNLHLESPDLLYGKIKQFIENIE